MLLGGVYSFQGIQLTVINKRKILIEFKRLFIFIDSLVGTGAADMQEIRHNLDDVRMRSIQCFANTLSLQHN